MRQGIFGTGVGVFLALAGWTLVGTASPPGKGSGLGLDEKSGGKGSVHVHVEGQGRHLFIVDERRSWFGVYELDLENGDVTLKVARNFASDVELQQVGRRHKPEVRSVGEFIEQ